MMDLAQIPKLPVSNGFDSKMRTKLRVFLVFVSLMSVLWVMIGIGAFWGRYPKPLWFLIGAIWAMVGVCVLAICLSNFVTLRHQHTLVIYDHKVAFLKHSLQSELYEIGFDKAYLATCVINHRYGDRVFLHHVEMSSDGRFYKLHKTMIAKLWGMETYSGQECVMLINTLIHAYHKNMGLVISCHPCDLSCSGRDELPSLK